MRILRVLGRFVLRIFRRPRRELKFTRKDKDGETEVVVKDL